MCVCVFVVVVGIRCQCVCMCFLVLSSCLPKELQYIMQNFLFLLHTFPSLCTYVVGMVCVMFIGQVLYCCCCCFFYFPLLPTPSTTSLCQDSTRIKSKSNREPTKVPSFSVALNRDAYTCFEKRCIQVC